MTWVTLSSFWRCSTLRLGPILLFTRLIISYLKKTNILDNVKLVVEPAWWGSRICGHPPPWEQSWSPDWSTRSPDKGVLAGQPGSKWEFCTMCWSVGKPRGRRQDSSQSKTRAQGFDLLIGELRCLWQKKGASRKYLKLRKPAASSSLGMYFSSSSSSCTSPSSSSWCSCFSASSVSTGSSSTWAASCCSSSCSGCSTVTGSTWIHDKGSHVIMDRQGCVYMLVSFNPLSYLRLEDRRRRSWGPTSTFKLTG